MSTCILAAVDPAEVDVLVIISWVVSTHAANLTGINELALLELYIKEQCFWWRDISSAILISSLGSDLVHRVLKLSIFGLGRFYHAASFDGLWL